MCSLPLYQGVEDITRTRPQQGNAGNVIKLTNVDRQKTEIKDSEADNHESRYLFCLFLSTPKRQIVICQKLTYSKE